ncbi:MAG: hypothetical protein EB084_02265 [Proteobacteria bacterium]|nr:hypothetical protein [Pseudomonadota bacterium]
MTRLADQARRAMHLAHQYQIVLAIIVASLVLTAAWFMPRSPVREEPMKAVAWGLLPHPSSGTTTTLA